MPSFREPRMPEAQQFPRRPLLGSSVNRGSGIPLLGDEATEAPRYGLKYNQPATDHSA